MKFVLATTALLMAASAASAADLGWGFTGGADADVNYTTGVGEFGLDLTPNVGYSAWGADIKVSTTLDLANINSIEFTGLDYSIEYPLAGMGATAYGEISSDADWDFGDATIGMRFSF